MDFGLSFAGLQDFFTTKQRDNNNEHGARHAVESDPSGRVGIRMFRQPYTNG